MPTNNKKITIPNAENNPKTIWLSNDPEQIIALEKKTENGIDTRKCNLKLFSGKKMMGWFGDFVINLKTMRFQKDRITLDHNHNNGQILGYAENYKLSDKGLFAEGTIVLGKAGEYDPTAKRIVELLDAKTPLECSTLVEIFGDGIEFREVGKKETEIVNGYEVSNCYVIENSILCGSTICPHGRDADTNTTLLNSKAKEKNEMKTKPEQKENASSTIENAATEPATNTEPVKNENSNPAVKDTRDELEALVTMFGEEQGLKLYRQHVSPELAKTYLEMKTIFDTSTKQENSKKPETAGQNATTQSQSTVKNENQSDKYAELMKELAQLKAVMNTGEKEPLSQNGSDGVPQKKNHFNAYAEKIQSSI